MQIEVLCFDGCPNYRMAAKTLREVLAEEGIEDEVNVVAINNDEDAQRLRFPGSPTIRVDGRDLFPVLQRASYALGCRTYATPGGLKGSPTREMLRGVPNQAMKCATHSGTDVVERADLGYQRVASVVPVAKDRRDPGDLRH